MIRFIFSIALLIPVGVMSWRIGENVTPETVMIGTVMLFALAGGLLFLVVVFVVLKFTANDRANERGHSAHAQQLEQRQSQAPVIVLQQPGRGQIEQSGRNEKKGFIEYCNEQERLHGEYWYRREENAEVKR